MTREDRVRHYTRIGIVSCVFLLGVYKGWRFVAFKPTVSIKVGILNSRTGSLGELGSQIIEATLLAIDEVNTKGGLLGKSIEAVIADGKSDAVTFAREAERLITEEKVELIFGCYGSTDRKAVLPIVEKHKKLLMYPFNYEGIEESKYIIYFGGTWNQQLLPAAVWMTRKFGNRLFLISTSGIYSYISSAQLGEVLPQIGVEIVGDVHIASDEDNFEPILKQIEAAKPDVVFSNIFGKPNAPFYVAMRKMAEKSGKKIPIITGTISDPSFATIGAENVAGSYSCWSYYEALQSDENIIFKKNFRQAFGEIKSINDVMEAAYNSVHMWAQAVSKAKSFNTKNMLDALLFSSNRESVVMRAPEGYIQIMDNRHAERRVRVAQANEQGKSEVQYETRAAEDPHPYASELFLVKAGMVKVQTDEQWQQYANSLLGKVSGQE